MFVDGGPGKKEIVSDQLITGDSAVATGSHRVIAPRAEVSQTTGRGRALLRARGGGRPSAASGRQSRGQDGRLEEAWPWAALSLKLDTPYYVLYRNH